MVEKDTYIVCEKIVEKQEDVFNRGTLLLPFSRNLIYSRTSYPVFIKQCKPNKKRKALKLNSIQEGPKIKLQDLNSHVLLNITML